MKLVLDEHFSPRIAIALRRRGHDVIAVMERTDMQGMSDRQLLSVADQDDRAVVTEDVADFAELHREMILTRMLHHGIIFTSRRRFRRNRAALGHVVRALDAFLADRPDVDALLSQTWWLEPVDDRRE